MELVEFWQECTKFLVDKGYVKQTNLEPLKDDMYSLIGIYRLHAFHYVNSQMIAVHNFVRKKVSKIFDEAVKDDEASSIESEDDYKDTDFEELMSKK